MSQDITFYDNDIGILLVFIQCSTETDLKTDKALMYLQKSPIFP